MHPNPVFRGAPEARAMAAARARGFGTLVANGLGGVPVVAQVPFVLGEDHAEFHLLRSNPLARAAPARALLVAIGPDGYVSPDWYGVADQVPTWNYVAVHLEGRFEMLPQEDLRAHLDRLSAEFEGRLPKAPWTAEKMSPEPLERMMRTIRPARLRIEAVRSTFKLGQNKPGEVRLRAAEAVEGSVGMELSALAALMRQPDTA